ncbi:MAG: hypothetical protein K6G15_00240 [Desulfovibrio sp.]|nr:hypothetical protein [Desulfovibrio sp.]
MVFRKPQSQAQGAKAKPSKADNDKTPLDRGTGLGSLRAAAHFSKRVTP